MKALSLLLLSALSLPALAAEGPAMDPPAAGAYAYAGDFRVLMRIRHETVRVVDAKSQKRLAELRTHGYECRSAQRPTWLCRKFLSPEGAEELVRSKIDTMLAGKTLELGEITGSPELISRGETVEIYQLRQTASFTGKSWDFIRLVNVQGNWSIRMGDPTELQFSLEEGALKRQLKIEVAESASAYSLFVVDAVFGKQ